MESNRAHFFFPLGVTQKGFHCETARISFHPHAVTLETMRGFRGEGNSDPQSTQMALHPLYQNHHHHVCLSGMACRISVCVAASRIEPRLFRFQVIHPLSFNRNCVPFWFTHILISCCWEIFEISCTSEIFNYFEWVKKSLGRELSVSAKRRGG